MNNLTVFDSGGIPPWLAADYHKSFPPEWQPAATAYLQQLVTQLGPNYPGRIDVIFKVSQDKLQIREETFRALTWTEANSMIASNDQFGETDGSETPAERLIDSKPVPISHEQLLFDLQIPTEFDGLKEKVCEFLDEPLPDDHEENLDLDPVEDLRDDCRQFHVFSWTPLTSGAMAAGLARDGDTSKRLKSTLSLLRKKGPARPFQFAVPDWQACLNRLECEFPNFTTVIQTIIRPHLAMLSKGCAHRMPPILLLGPAGVGKTQFARELKKILSVPTLFLDMAAETNGSGLGGSSVFWANASPGKLFEQLAWGSGSTPVANPLVILDEVDKVNASQYNPLASLYSLLEVETASRFQDQAVPDVFLDLSKVRFILTANDQAQIPAPLLDRVRTFEIEPPSAEGMRKIAQRIFESLLFEYDLELSPVLPAAMLDDIPGLGPR